MSLYHRDHIKGIAMIKDRRGSITVEAAVALPIFVFCIVTMAFFIKIVFIHEKVQFALTDAANELALYSYVYDKTGLLGVVNDAKNATEEAKKAAEENFSNITDSAKSIKEQVENVLLEFQNIENAVKNTAAVDVDIDGNTGGYTDIFSKISDAITKVSESRKNIEESVKSAYSSVETVINSFNSLLENRKSIEALAANKGIKFVEKALGNASIKALMKKHLTNDDLLRYHIVDGYDGLDFSKSSYFVKDSDIDTDNVIDVIVSYKIKIPVPVKIIDEIPVVQRVTVRAWTGK